MADEIAPFASEEDDGESSEETWADAVEEDEGRSFEDSSWWLRLVGLLSGRARSNNGRRDKLDKAIEAYPNAAANYVLRGEWYLQANEPELAAEDFEMALHLASARFERENWGVLSQVMRDRAERDLELARRQLKKKR